MGDWSEALQIFESELGDQPKPAPKPGVDDNGKEGRWQLETFSMWLLKKGKRLRECTQWFSAFDFDQDSMVGVVDFLHGLVAVAAPRPATTGSVVNLCSSFAIFRLLELEKKQSLEARDLEDAKVSLASIDSTLTPQQISQRLTDFEYFRTALAPRLQGAAAYKLRVFGSSTASDT